MPVIVTTVLAPFGILATNASIAAVTEGVLAPLGILTILEL
jgi:hypothetical protein